MAPCVIKVSRLVVTPPEPRNTATSNALARRREADESIATLIGDCQIIGQSGDVATQVNVRLSQQRTQVQNIRARIEAGHLIFAVTVQHEGIAAGAREELKRMASWTRIDHTVAGGDRDRSSNGKRGGDRGLGVAGWLAMNAVVALAGGDEHRSEINWSTPLITFVAAALNAADSGAPWVTPIPAFPVWLVKSSATAILFHNSMASALDAPLAIANAAAPSPTAPVVV